MKILGTLFVDLCLLMLAAYPLGAALLVLRPVLGETLAYRTAFSVLLSLYIALIAAGIRMRKGTK